MPKMYHMHRNNGNLHTKLVIKSGKPDSTSHESLKSTLISQRSLIKKTNEYIKRKNNQAAQLDTTTNLAQDVNNTKENFVNYFTKPSENTETTNRDRSGFYPTNNSYQQV